MKKRLRFLLTLWFLLLVSCSSDTSSKPDLTITIDEVICFGSDRGVRIITDGPETISRVWCQGGERRGVGHAYDKPIDITILGDSFCLITEIDEKLLVSLEVGDKDAITQRKSSFCYISEARPLPEGDQGESY